MLRHLLAVQAQDVRTPALALAARGGALRRRDAHHVADARRRCTSCDADDLAWLHPLFAPRMATTNARRLRQLGVSEEQADARGRADRRARCRRRRAGARFAPRGARHPDRGQAIAHLLARAAMQGRVALTADRTFVPLRLPAQAG